MNAVGMESPSLPGQDYSTLVPSEAVSVETAFERAGLLHEQGKFDQAEQLYQAILQIDPDHVGSLYNLGILYFQWGRYDDTVALTNKVVRLRPDFAAAHNAMGVALKHLGRLQEAEVCCREALRIAPGSAEAHNTLGDVLMTLRRWNEAEECFRKALRLAPQYSEAHNNLGNVLLSLGRPKEAEICCREALRLKPGNMVPLHNLSTILISLRRLREAADYCRDILSHEPGNAGALQNLSIALYLQQEVGEVAALLGRAMLLKPDFISALLFLLFYLISGNIVLAAGIIIGAGLVQLRGIKFPGRELAPMRWTRFVLIAVLASASIVTQNPRFVMIQPSVVDFTAAILMLRRGGMIRYIAPIAWQRVPESVTLAAGYTWAALLVALGLTNLVIALYFGLAAWAWFILISAIGTKALRYTVFCMIVRRRLAQLQANP